jgi:hypothetical protein
LDNLSIVAFPPNLWMHHINNGQHRIFHTQPLGIRLKALILTKSQTPMNSQCDVPPSFIVPARTFCNDPCNDSRYSPSDTKAAPAAENSPSISSRPSPLGPVSIHFIHIQ